MVTGGEPLLQQRTGGWRTLTKQLSEVAPIEIETNGTISPDPDTPATYNVSPKLAHAGDPERARINRTALAAFAELVKDGKATLKVVVRTTDDVHAAAALARSINWPTTRVYVMPEGTTTAALTRAHARLAHAAEAEGLNMTTRLHVLTWGQERGR